MSEKQEGGSEKPRNDNPFVVTTYGNSGIGKTTDMGYSFPTALFLAAPGALESVKSTCGYTPTEHFVRTIPEATEVIKLVGQSSKYDTVVIDDFSFMAEQTFAALEASGFRNFKLWGKLREVTIEFRDVSRYCGVNVVLNAWEQGPKTKDNGQYIMGGPMLSGRLPEQIPALSDLVLRAVYEEKRKPWPGAYRCWPNPSYVMKDRFNVAYRIDPCPMNLGELLRASGKDIRRLWPEQEEEVEALVSGPEAVFKGDPSTDPDMADTAYQMLVNKGQPVTRARWTVRDALDRALIRAALRKGETSFFGSFGQSNNTNTLG